MDIIEIRANFVYVKKLTSKKTNQEFFIYKILYNNESVNLFSNQELGNFKLGQAVIVSLKVSIFNENFSLKLDKIS